MYQINFVRYFRLAIEWKSIMLYCSPPHRIKLCDFHLLPFAIHAIARSLPVTSPRNQLPPSIREEPACGLRDLLQSVRSLLPPIAPLTLLADTKWQAIFALATAPDRGDEIGKRWEWNWNSLHFINPLCNTKYWGKCTFLCHISHFACCKKEPTWKIAALSLSAELNAFFNSQ